MAYTSKKLAYTKSAIGSSPKQTGQINISFEYAELTPQLNEFLEEIVNHFLTKASNVDTITNYNWDFQFGFTKKPSK